jgi:hypothetical protein
MTVVYDAAENRESKRIQEVVVYSKFNLAATKIAGDYGQKMSYLFQQRKIDENDGGACFDGTRERTMRTREEILGPLKRTLAVITYDFFTGNIVRTWLREPVYGGLKNPYCSYRGGRGCRTGRWPP